MICEKRKHAYLIYWREFHAWICPFGGLKKKLMALIVFDIIWDLALLQRGLGEMHKTQVEFKKKAKEERDEKEQKLWLGIGLNPCYVGPQIWILSFLTLNMHIYTHTYKKKHGQLYNLLFQRDKS